jgi:putative inorganic carbon (hco3(-)) transporter
VRGPLALRDTGPILLAVLGAALVAALFTVSAYQVNPFALPAALIAIAFVVVAFRWPYLGLSGALLASPLEIVNLPLPTGSLSPSEGALVLVGLVWVARLLFRPETVAHPQARDLPLLVLLIAVVVGLAIALQPSPVIRVFLLWTLFVCVYFQAQSFTPRQMRTVIRAFAVGAGILGAIGAVKYLNSPNARLYAGGTATGDRASGTFTQANYFASLLQLALLPGIALALSDLRRNAWMVPWIVAAVGGLLFSLSRGGISGFAIGLLLLLVWNRARWIALALTFVFVLLTILNANPIVKSDQFGNVTERLSTISHPGESVTNNRPRIWSTAINVTEAHPFFGVGVNQFQDEAARQSLTERGAPLENAHNIFLSLSAETGLIGLAAFLVFVVELGRRALRALAVDSTLPLALALGLAATLLGFFVQGLTAAQIRDNILMGTFLAFAGMLTGLADRAGPVAVGRGQGARPQARSRIPA